MRQSAPSMHDVALSCERRLPSVETHTVRTAMVTKHVRRAAASAEPDSARWRAGSVRPCQVLTCATWSSTVAAVAPLIVLIRPRNAFKMVLFCRMSVVPLVKVCA